MNAALDRSKNSVWVAPGHNARTRTPEPRLSHHSGSVNDKTNALVAA